MTTMFIVSLVALWIITLFSAFLLIGLARAMNGATIQVEAAPESVLSEENAMRGKQAPEFRAEDLEGNVITKGDLLGRPAALLFVSPDCESCGVTLMELEALSSKVDGQVVVFCRAEGERCGELAATYGFSAPVVHDEGYAFSKLFRVAGAPTAVLLSEEGVVETYGRPMAPDDLQKEFDQAGWAGAAEPEYSTQSNSTIDGVPMNVTEVN